MGTRIPIFSFEDIPVGWFEGNQAIAPGQAKRRGTGKVFPTRFTPPTSSIRPTELFSRIALLEHVNAIRYTHPVDIESVLLFTDGACLNNGQPDPRAGWALVHGLQRTGEPAIAFGRLENKGPFGDEGIQSSNRAELRAVIAALRFRFWIGEGIRTLTIATDSEYVVEGSTEWARTWVRNDWKTQGNLDVKNKDLWEMLLGDVERWHEAGLTVRFWRIPREWNETADVAAKRAASQDEVDDEWVDVNGFNF
ncbi:Mevalonate kinase [Hypoxylon texense]